MKILDRSRWLARRRLTAFLRRFSVEDLAGLARYMASGRPIVFGGRCVFSPGWKGQSVAWPLTSAMRNPEPNRQALPAPIPDEEHTAREVVGVLRASGAPLLYLDIRRCVKSALKDAVRRKVRQ